MTKAMAPAELFHELVALEERLQGAEVRTDPSALDALLAPDFMEFGASGAVWRREALIEALHGASAEDLRMQDLHLQLLAEDVGLLTYRAVRDAQPAGRATTSLRSSIWKRLGPHWQLVFHQGSPWVSSELPHAPR